MIHNDLMTMLNNGRKTTKGFFHQFWDVSLILAIISAIFILLWTIYCKAFFIQLSFPYQYLDLPYIMVIPDLIRIILVSNLHIILILFIIVSRINYINQENLRYFRDITYRIIICTIIVPILLMILSYLTGNYYNIVRNAAIEIMVLTQNYYVILLALIFIFYYIMNYLKNKKKYKITINVYTSPVEQKYKTLIFIILPIIVLNYGFVNLTATENAVNLINGFGSKITLIPNDYTTIQIPNELMFVLLDENNYFVVEMAKETYNLSNNKYNKTYPKLYVIPIDKIKLAIISENKSIPPKNDISPNILFILFFYFIIYFIIYIYTYIFQWSISMQIK